MDPNNPADADRPLSIAERAALAAKRTAEANVQASGIARAKASAVKQPDNVAMTVTERTALAAAKAQVVDGGKEEPSGAEIGGVTAAAGATAAASKAAEDNAKAPTEATAVALAEANEALNAAGTKSLKEKLAEALAKTSSPTAAGLTTGVGNSATMGAVNAAQLAAAREAAVIVPVKTSSDQVLFKTAKASLGSATPSAKRFKFTHQYLLTSDKDIIDFVRANAALWLVTEEGSTPPKQPLQQPR